MATRLYLCAAETTPVTPGFAAWQETDGALRRRMRSFTGGDTLANGSAQASTAGNTQLHRQYVSDPLASGITFTSGVSTLSCQIQGLESAANDNIINRVRAVKIYSQDGNTLRATLIALGNASSVTEWNTAMRNLTFLNATAVGATYTTVDGDRLVLEVGHDDSAGSTVSGTLRFGADSGGTGDLGSNETDTTTTLRPWFESSVNLTFLAQDVSGANIASTALFAGTVSVSVSGATIASTQLFAGSVGLNVDGATIASTQLFAGAVALEVNGATIAATQLFAGTVSSGGGDQNVDGSTISATSLFAGSIAPEINGANISATQLFAGSVGLNVGGATIASTQLFAGAVSLTVSGAHVSATQLFAGSVAADGSISGATIASTQLFAGSLSVDVAGAHISATSLFAGTVSSTPTVVGATIASTQLFAGSVSGGGSGPAAEYYRTVYIKAEARWVVVPAPPWVSIKAEDRVVAVEQEE